MNREKEKISSKSWWRWFWVTIIALLVVYLLMLFLASNTDISTKQGRKNYLNEMREVVQKISPDLEKYIVNLSEMSKENIRKTIHEEVAKAYEPVYTVGIDNFSDFHYSVLGEYTELFDTAADGSRNYLDMDKKDNFDNLVYEELFQSTEFDTHLKDAYKNINIFAFNEMTQNLDNLHKKVQNDLNVSDAQADFLIQQIFQMGISDMKERFSNKIGNSFRASGVTGGAIAGALVSKQVAKLFAKKVGTKLAVKGGTKVAGAIVTGAIVGAESGLLCGPGAVLCSPVGAVVGGITGWFMTDVAVAAFDEHYNKEAFKDEIRDIVNKQQIQTEEQLNSIYTTTIDEINIEDKDKLEEFKHKQNKDNF